MKTIKNTSLGGWLPADEFVSHIVAEQMRESVD